MTKPFTIDPSRESFYAPSLVTQAIREELNKPAVVDATMEELSTLTDKTQIIGKIYNRVIAKVLEKFKNDTKVIADCAKEGITPESLKNHYNSRVLDAAERAFNEWQARHPENQFRASSPVDFEEETPSLFDRCIIG